MVIIKAVELSVKLGSRCVIPPVSFEINQHEHWAVVGYSGSGKTTLLHTLAGMQFHSGHLDIEPGMKVIMVEQQHRFKNLSNTSNFYYQQRFNSFDSEDTVTVEAYLQPYLPIQDQEVMKLLDVLGVNDIRHRKLIQLSNGENKRLQLAKAVLQQPDILLLDNPFTGLDVVAREKLEQLLHTIARYGIHIIIVTAQNLVPSFITHVLKLNEEDKATVYTAKEYQPVLDQEKQSLKTDAQLLQKLTATGKVHEFKNAVHMHNVQVRYGAKEVLKNVSWQVKEGERWAVSGHNGAGKSTLLSLINGDNPQAYANEIYLFDKRRGSGETIWDIKRKIGYVSPELHLYFPPSISVFKAVASGLFDTMGLFRQLNGEQIKRVSDWVRLFGLQHICNRLLSHVSTGEQRLTLLARALVKNPALLILDEPSQGLDTVQTAAFKDMVELICTHTNKTLIYVSHFQEEIPTCVDRFIRLKEGEIVERK